MKKSPLRVSYAKQNEKNPLSSFLLQSKMKKKTYKSDNITKLQNIQHKNDNSKLIFWHYCTEFPKKYLQQELQNWKSNKITKQPETTIKKLLNQNVSAVPVLKVEKKKYYNSFALERVVGLAFDLKASSRSLVDDQPTRRPATTTYLPDILNSAITRLKASEKKNDDKTWTITANGRCMLSWFRGIVWCQNCERKES